MTNFYRALSLALVLSSFAIAKPVSAQDTWQEVYTILSTNCTGSGCHAGSRQDFDVSASSSDLYTALIGQDPLNPAALAKGDKYIDPGYPARSFLLRKVANCISGDLALEPAEGNNMPQGRPALAEQDIELIRQWILFGAPETGEVVRKAVIDEYYTVGGVDKIERPTPPKSCEGFQVHMGPIFFEPGEESEYFQKYDLDVADSLEVIGLEVFFNDESHHFILRKFRSGTAQNWPQGLTPLNPLTAFDSDKDYVMAWQDNEDFRLPNGTAYKWSPGESLDLNFHMFNYHNQILAGEVYLNVYTQPKGTAEKEMKSALITNLNIFLAPNSTQTLTERDNMVNKSIWTLTSHTHKFGTNFDIFFKNADNSKGRIVYDGSFNYLQGFDTGSYDWEHPPTVRYEPFLDMNDTVNNGTKPTGFVYEASYNNTSNNLITFGFTTEQEMMIYYAQFVDGQYDIPAAPLWTSPCSAERFIDPCLNDTTGIIEFASGNDVGMSIYPNPTTNLANINYTLDNNANAVKLEVVNMLGEVVSSLVTNEQQQIGSYSYHFNGAEHNQGVYIVRLSVDGKVSTHKLILSGN